MCLGWNEAHVEDQPSIILKHRTCCKNYIWPPKRQFKNKLTKKWLDDFKHDNFKMITYQVSNNRSKNDLSMDVSLRKCWLKLCRTLFFPTLFLNASMIWSWFIDMYITSWRSWKIAPHISTFFIFLVACNCQTFRTCQQQRKIKTCFIVQMILCMHTQWKKLMHWLGAQTL